MKDKIGVVIILVVLAGIYYFFYSSNEEKDLLVKSFGNYYLSEIHRKVPLGNSGSNRINHLVKSDNEEIPLSNYISDEYYDQIMEGDTILIRAIISDTLVWSVLDEEKKHLIPCLKKIKPPSNGWSDLPILECNK